MSKDEVLEVEVLNNSDSPPIPLGNLQIPLIDLYSQNKVEDLYPLDNNGNGAKIHLQLRWIHSKVKFYEDLIKVWQN